jgi:predicted DNA-binding protein (MmcQ/YjbR family)
MKFETMMDLESLRTYCLSKTGVTESTPFGDDILVYKVMEKAFILAGIDSFPPSFNAKCDPEYAIELRESHPQHILPGYHMNKKHWNTIIMDGELPEPLTRGLIDQSYELVVQGLTKKQKEALQQFK